VICLKTTLSKNINVFRIAFGDVQFIASFPPDYQFTGSEFIGKHKPIFLSGNKAKNRSALHDYLFAMRYVTLRSSDAQAVPEVDCNKEQTLSVAAREGPSSEKQPV
jgi:hypothetical protein